MTRDQNSFIIQSQGIWVYSENLVYRILEALWIHLLQELFRRGTKYVNVKAIDIFYMEK